MAQLKSHMNSDGLVASNISSAANGIRRGGGCTSAAAGFAGCTLIANSLIAVFSSLSSPSKNLPGVELLKKPTPRKHKQTNSNPRPPGSCSYNKAFWKGLEAPLRRYKIVSKILLKIQDLDTNPEKHSRHRGRGWMVTFNLHCHFQWTTTLSKERKMEGTKKEYVPEKFF